MTDTPPAPDPRRDLTAAERTERAAAYRAAAGRARRTAERLRTIAGRPARALPPDLDGLPTDAHMAALYAAHPRLAQHAAEQHEQLADAWDRHATHLTRTTHR